MKTKYRLTLKIPERVTRIIIMMFRLIKFSDKEMYDNLNRIGLFQLRFEVVWGCLTLTNYNLL